MNVDELRRVLDAAAGREPDLGAGRRSVRGRVRRHRAIVVGMVVAAITITTVPFVLVTRDTSDTGPIASKPMRPVEPGTRRIVSSEYGFSVDVPAAWATELGNPSIEVMPVLFDAQSLRPAVDLPRLDECAAWADVSVTLVRVQEIGHLAPVPLDRAAAKDPGLVQSFSRARPPHFGPPYGDTTTTCADTVWREVSFNQHGRGFSALVVAGARTPTEDVERAYEVLDSFRPGPPTVSTFCTWADDFAKPNPGAGSPGRDAALRVKGLRRVAPSRTITDALDVVEPALARLDSLPRAQWREDLTSGERQAFRVLDDALQECGLTTEIFDVSLDD